MIQAVREDSTERNWKVKKLEKVGEAQRSDLHEVQMEFGIGILGNNIAQVSSSGRLWCAPEKKKKNGGNCTKLYKKLEKQRSREFNAWGHIPEQDEQ